MTFWELEDNFRAEVMKIADLEEHGPEHALREHGLIAEIFAQCNNMLMQKDNFYILYN